MNDAASKLAAGYHLRSDEPPLARLENTGRADSTTDPNLTFIHRRPSNERAPRIDGMLTR
jgi:hypothetical protein